MDAFAALADPTRREIVAMLGPGPLSAGEVAAAFPVTAAAVSQHLKVLREAGVVTVEVEGQRRIYRLNEEVFRQIAAWLSKPGDTRRYPLPPITFVDATTLDAWASRRDAQSALPDVVRRMIFGTVQHVEKIGFRASEGIQLGGWDGILEVEEGNAFVPNGKSVWELGTGEDSRAKAERDFRNRIANPRGVAPRQAVFIFVTPRRWAGKAQWVQERQREGVWHDVRAYDADDLETWLQLAPAVHVWLS